MNERNVLHIMDSTGDTQLTYRRPSTVLLDTITAIPTAVGETSAAVSVAAASMLDDIAELTAAQAAFDAAKAQGNLAYKMDADGSNAEVIREFDQTAERIVMSPQLVGG